MCLNRVSGDVQSLSPADQVDTQRLADAITQADVYGMLGQQLCLFALHESLAVDDLGNEDRGKIHSCPPGCRSCFRSVAPGYTTHAVLHIKETA
jgi:hypothetical protein